MGQDTHSELTDASASTDPVEAVTRQFYEWERCGRGWQVWPFHVELEPVFEPFRFHAPRLQSRGRDDGQHPTLLSRFTDRLLNGRPLIISGEPEMRSELEPEPERDLSLGDVAELQLTMPVESDVSTEAVEHFLLSLPRLSRPIGFEVIGDHAQIMIQFTCGAPDGAILSEHLRAYFPDATLSSTAGGLAGRWQAAAAGHSVVVEFGLDAEFMVPLRVLRRLSVDPLTAIGAALSNLQGGDVGVLQVLLQPVCRPWAQSIMNAVLDEQGSPFFFDAPEVTSLAKEKISSPLFASVIRGAGRSPSPERALLIARSIGWALNTIGSPPGNRLIPLTNDDYPDDAHERDLLARQTHRSGMILGAAELVSLVHPPSASVRIEKLIRQAGKTRGAPAIAAGHAYVLGSNAHAGRTIDVALNADQRSRHLYLIGASGTGKSTLMLNLILQDLERGEGLAVLDPHGDLVDEILHRMPAERLDDVVLLDPADGEFPIGFNILSAHSELERTLLASDLVAVFRRLSTSWGDQMTSVLGNAILAILESERGGTLVDLRHFLVEPEFRREFLKGVGDPEVVYFWQKEFPLLAGKPQAPLLTRLDTFLRPKPIRYMVAQRESRLDLRRLMDERKILLARLSQGAIGEENATLLGTLLVSKLHQFAISRQEIAAAERRPFYLYIDEFQNFVTPSMEQILSGARKYRLGLILAHQDLRQIQSRSADVLNSVLSNPYTRVCFRVGEHDARTLADGFTHFGARDLQSLGTGQALARVERAEYDFNLSTTMLPSVDQDEGRQRRQRIVARSRAEFGRPRSEIEALLGHAADLRPEIVEPSTPVTMRRRPVEPAPLEVVAVAPSRPQAVEIPTPATTPGRGGAQHKYLQELICRWADANDWRATIEERVLDGLGNVDVALRKADRAVACEISVTTSPEHELQNIQKCLTAGFERVVVISPEQRALKQIERLAASALAADVVTRVTYCTPEEAFNILHAIEAESRTLDHTVRGYKVRLRVSSGSSATEPKAQETVAGVIARALKRLRKQ